jgi:hypothetical protein
MFAGLVFLAGWHRGWLARRRWMFCPRPEGTNTGGFVLAHRIGERPRADAIDIAAVINQMAGRFDDQFPVWIPDDVVHRAQSILNVPCQEVSAADTLVLLPD